MLRRKIHESPFHQLAYQLINESTHLQRIVIKNFGPIREIDMPIRDLTILIGPNASGKSLVARLVYFFVSLQEEVRKKIVAGSWAGLALIDLSEADIWEDFQVEVIERGFVAIFGNK